MTRSRIDHRVAFGQRDAQQEMTRERHAAHGNIHLRRHLQIQHRQRDRDTAPALEHHVQVAVIRVVVIVDVRPEAQFAKEVTVQNADALLDVGIVRNAALDAQGEFVDLREHGLQIEIGIGVLRERERRLR
jgi:hypothetical protein